MTTTAAAQAPGDPAAAPALPAVAAGRRRRWLAALVANGLTRSLLAVALVVALRAFVDHHASGGAPLPAVLTLALLGAMALGVAVTAALRWRETVDAEALAQHYIAHVRLRLFDRLGRMTPREALRRSRGGVLLRFVGDAQALRAWVGHGIAQAVTAVTVGGVLLGALAWLAPAAAAAVALWWLLLGALAWHGMPALCAATRLARRRQAQLAANVGDRIAGLPVLQAAGRQRDERERLRRQQRRLRRALQERARHRGRLRALAHLAAGGTGLLVLGQALWSLGAGTGATSLGSAFAAAALAGLLAAPLRAAGRAAEAWAGAEVARQRVQEFLASRDRPPAGASAAALPPRSVEVGAGRLEWRGATAAGRVGPVDAVAMPGRRIAVCGAPGSGKSSLLALAAGLLPPDDGDVAFDGQPVAALPLQARQRRVALVAPELGLLRGTVGATLRYHWPQAPDAVLEHAARLAGLAPMLERWPQGLDTPVRDGGLNLGQAERRALQLARALVGQPAVLLIDDAQAALPGDPAAALAALVDGFDGTLVYSTSEPRLAALADDVWTLERGRLRDARHPASPWSAGAPALH